jgi:hypothetical protein
MQLDPESSGPMAGRRAAPRLWRAGRDGVARSLIEDSAPRTLLFWNRRSLGASAATHFLRPELGYDRPVSAESRSFPSCGRGTIEGGRNEI